MIGGIHDSTEPINNETVTTFDGSVLNFGVNCTQSILCSAAHAIQFVTKPEPVPAKALAPNCTLAQLSNKCLKPWCALPCCRQLLCWESPIAAKESWGPSSLWTEGELYI